MFTFLPGSSCGEFFFPPNKKTVHWEKKNTHRNSRGGVAGGAKKKKDTEKSLFPTYRGMTNGRNMEVREELDGHDGFPYFLGENKVGVVNAPWKKKFFFSNHCNLLGAFHPLVRRTKEVGRDGGGEEAQRFPDIQVCPQVKWTSCNDQKSIWFPEKKNN